MNEVIKKKKDEDFHRMLEIAMKNPDNLDDFLDHLYLEIGDVRELKLENPMLSSAWDDPNQIPELIAVMCLEPEYLHFITKYFLNIDLLPYQLVVLHTLWTKSLPMLIATRGGAKSYMLAVYGTLRLILHQGCKVCVVGASLRQSMVIFNYCQNIYENAPLVREMCGKGEAGKLKRDVHMCHWTVGKSKATFLPLGNGEKIRGQRANYILIDEFASIGVEIYETVLRGFAAVKSDGVHGNVAKDYKNKANRFINPQADDYEVKLIDGQLEGNQIVLAGTAGYQFNHFYKYYQYYHAIITTHGDKQLLKKEFPDMPAPDNIDASQYAILRIPCEYIPEGMMDQTILAQGKATMDPSIFMMEYSACFRSDSEGFYLASALNRATCPIKIGEAIIDFNPKLVGDHNKRYVMGIDPASEDDNFTIHIIEINENYRASVYQWATNRKEFEALKRDPLKPIKEEIKDYNTFVIKHIRDLLRRFSVELICMDAGGGGVSIKELFRDSDKLLDDSDELIYDIDDEEIKGLKGRHILKMIQFSSGEWRVMSHHGLRKDIIDLKLIFPKYDASMVEMEAYTDSSLGNIFDTMEDNALEIEQCKQETTLIKHSQTEKGSESWDVPKITGLDAAQVRKQLKRDRFTSLLLANWAARLITADEHIRPDGIFGGVASEMRGKNISGAPFIGKGASRLKNMPEYHLEECQVNSSQNINGRRILY